MSISRAKGLISSEALSIKYQECVCLYSCLSYPAGKSHFSYWALRCHLWPVRLYHVFPHYLIKGRILEKKLNTKYMSLFSLQLSSQRFLNLRTFRWVIINVHRSSLKAPVILFIFQSNLHFLHKYSKNPQISNFMIIRTGGGEFSHVDWHEEFNSRFSQIRERA